MTQKLEEGDYFYTENVSDADILSFRHGRDIGGIAFNAMVWLNGTWTLTLTRQYSSARKREIDVPLLPAMDREGIRNAYITLYETSDGKYDPGLRYVYDRLTRETILF